ncbi:hypothetical protein FDUTEX481_08397 [Tolypothrix sp. PCC 7601]|nr:hypothetical protein FDUTEX481_08397 [Tolypothrix sp. PCC 7601]
MGIGGWGLGNSGPPLGIRGNGDWGTRGPLWGSGVMGIRGMTILQGIAF